MVQDRSLPALQTAPATVTQAEGLVLYEDMVLGAHL